MKNLVYTTIGYSLTWFNIIKLLLDSLQLYSNPVMFDFLIICDENMYMYISDYLENNSKYKFNICIFNILKNSFAPHEASMNKVNIFEYENINEYDKILFIDGDIYSTLNINTIFEHEISENILYVYKETSNILDHNAIYWGFSNYTHDELEQFRIKHMYPFNCGLFLFKNTVEMKTDFNNILLMMKNHKGTFFYEQSFMNYYFNKKNNVNHDIFTKDNYVMFPNDMINYTNKIIHFCNANNSSATKFERMIAYIHHHKLDLQN